MKKTILILITIMVMALTFFVSCDNNIKPLSLEEVKFLLVKMHPITKFTENIPYQNENLKDNSKNSDIKDISLIKHFTVEKNDDDMFKNIKVTKLNYYNNPSENKEYADYILEYLNKEGKDTKTSIKLINEDPKSVNGPVYKLFVNGKEYKTPDNFYLNNAILI